jgi:hypothetical protein
MIMSTSSLLNAEDMVRLLESFGKHRCAQDLRAAVKEWRYTLFTPPSSSRSIVDDSIVSWLI